MLHCSPFLFGPMLLVSFFCWQIMLLEDALRAERVENARLRVAATGCPGSDDDLSAGAGLRRSRIRRRSTGDDGVGHVRNSSVYTANLYWYEVVV